MRVDGSNTAEPLVTIGIPSFNCAAHIGEALESALGQTYEHLEVIVVDDASTDRSFEVICGFDDPRLRVLSNPQNLGAAENWNKVVSLASGAFIKLLHCDDLLEPDAIREQVEAMERFPGVVLASSRRRIVDERGRKLATRGARWPEGSYAGAEVLRRLVRSGANLIGEPSAALIRSEALSVVGGFDQGAGYAVDLDLWVRLLRAGDLYFSPKPLAAYRVRRGQLSARFAREQGADTARLFETLAADDSLAIPQDELVRGLRVARRQAVMRRVFAMGASARSGRQGGSRQ